MYKDATPPRAIAHLKQVYDATDIPADVYSRVWVEIERNNRASRRRAPHQALKTLAVCWWGAVLCLFFYHAFYSYEISEKLKSEQPTARVVVTRGHAEVIQNHEKKLVRAGVDLANPSTVQTFSNKAILEIGRHRVEVDKQTSFHIRTLSSQKLEFEVSRGGAAFKVQKLSADSTLTVQAGELKVSVVGTAFHVQHTGSCASVSVQEGRVKAEFGQRTVYISAGGSEQFCGHDSGSAEEESERAQLEEEENTETQLREAPPSPVELPEETKPQKTLRATGYQARRKANSTGEAAAPNDTGDQVEGRDVDTSLSEEERLIKKAHKFIAENKREAALESFMDYVTTYPNGLFAEEALFNAVRQSYWLKRMNDVMKYSEKFLERSFAHGYKATEIRIIRAQAILTLNENPNQAIETLKPVLSALETVSSRYRGQAMYLYVLGAHRAGQKEECMTWAEKYLKSFPSGRYADTIQKFISKKNEK